GLGVRWICRAIGQPAVEFLSLCVRQRSATLLGQHTIENLLRQSDPLCHRHSFNTQPLWGCVHVVTSSTSPNRHRHQHTRCSIRLRVGHTIPALRTGEVEPFFLARAPGWFPMRVSRCSRCPPLPTKSTPTRRSRSTS